MTYYIYQHVTPNGKRYIGQTCKKPERRWCKGNGYIGQMFFNAINKYGWQNIKHEILAEVETKKEADCLERLFIAGYESNNRKYGYNLTSGGEGVSGHVHSESAKERMRAAKIELCKDPEYIAGMSERAKIKWSEPGFREKMMRDVYKNPEVREKYTEANIRSWADPEVRRKRTDGINRAHAADPGYSERISEGIKRNFASLSDDERAKRRNTAIENGKKVSRPVKQIKDGETIRVFDSISEASRAVGRNHCSISGALHGRCKTCAGYVWEFV